MKRHALDPQGGAALFELGRTIARTHPPQIGKQRSGPGQGTEDPGGLIAETEQGDTTRLEALIADDLLSPVDILGIEPRQISLRGAQMPGQFVTADSSGVSGQGGAGDGMRNH